MKILFVGNQNSGKTTLFNILSGSSAQTGNRAGVTVAQKCAHLSANPPTFGNKKPIKLFSRRNKKSKVDEAWQITDLPGTYSLTPASCEEQITVDRLNAKDYDLIVNVIDGTALEKGLNLSLQLTKLGKPLVLAINFQDELSRRGVTVNVGVIEKLLGSPTILISSATGHGLNQLYKTITSGKINAPPARAFDSADERFRFIDQLIPLATTTRKIKSKKRPFDLDVILLNKYLAIPSFFAIVFLFFHISLGGVGAFLSNALSEAVTNFAGAVGAFLDRNNVSPVASMLVTSAMIGGVGSVAAFTPQLFIMFLLLDALESTGYMTRVAFIFDGFFSKLGLSGKSIVPFIVGCGCTVPAVYSARTLENEYQKTITSILCPFVPCSAKLPVIALFIGKFFPGNAALVAILLYLFAVLLIMANAILLRALLRPKPSIFLYELTPYRLPIPSQVLSSSLKKTAGYVKRVGGTVLLSSVAVWFLATFTPTLAVAETIKESTLAALGSALSPVLYPVLGTKSWSATVCALQGVISKEQIVSSMSVISSLESVSNPFDCSAFSFFTKSTAISYLAFNLFSPPCVSALAALRGEIGIKNAMLAASFHLTQALFISTTLRLILSAL